MKRVWVFYVLFPVLALTILLGIGFSGSTAAAPGLGELHQAEPVVFTESADAIDPNVTFRLVNEKRQERGITPLIAHNALGQLAAERARDMADRQYYAHKNPDGNYYYEMFESHGYEAGYSCENLDLVFVPSQELVIHEWTASLNGHKDCMLHANVTHAGYATARIMLIDFSGNETMAYVVVAIHASPANY